MKICDIKNMKYLKYFRVKNYNYTCLILWNIYYNESDINQCDVLFLLILNMRYLQPQLIISTFQSNGTKLMIKIASKCVTFHLNRFVSRFLSLIVKFFHSTFFCAWMFYMKLLFRNVSFAIFCSICHW